MVDGLRTVNPILWKSLRIVLEIVGFFFVNNIFKNAFSVF